MKKLLLIGVISIIPFVSFCQTCLNKYTSDQATGMVANFRAENNLPSKVSVWFNKTVIENIIALLNNENDDGIRIYFGALSNGDPSTNTVILVSTKQGGPDPNVPSKHLHIDYFAHDVNNALFKTLLATPGLAGEPCYDNICKGGALLYQNCGTATVPCSDDKNCSTSSIHYITRSYGQSMVWNFGSSLVSSKGEWFDKGMLIDMDTEMLKVSNYDGMRVYFAKHTSSDLISPGAEAFVIEPTTGSADVNLHLDYFNCARAQAYFEKFNKNIDALINQYAIDNGLDPTKEKDRIVISKLRALVLANGLDNGEICPTHCDTNSPLN